MTMPKTKHPIQPLQMENGVLRFKRNKIVEHLLEQGGVDMNQIARLDFSQEDREQFAQLIGYSHSGSGDLGYVSDEVWCAAQAMYEKGQSESDARIDYLNQRLKEAKDGMREGVAVLFSIHPDDLDGHV